jgi:hypothetical protein
MVRRAPLLALALTLAWAHGARGTARIARRSGLNCTMCHVDARGRLGLTEVGKRHQRRGLRASLDPELTVPGELRPLSPGGARMLHRRVRELGRRLFRMRDLGRSRQACQSCHAGGEGLSSDLVGRYPRFREDRKRWMTLEAAIQDCLVHRVGSERLKPGSRSAIALQLYVREASGQPASPYVDDAAWGMASKPGEASSAPLAAPIEEAEGPDALPDVMDMPEEPEAPDVPESEDGGEAMDEDEGGDGLDGLDMDGLDDLDGDL